MTVTLLTEHLLEFLSFKGSCTGSPESTLVKIPHCWKSHIEGNEAYNNMQVNTFPLHTPSAPGVGSRGQNFFSENGDVAYQKGMKRRASCKQNVDLINPLISGDGLKGQILKLCSFKYIFIELSTLTINL